MPESSLHPPSSHHDYDNGLGKQPWLVEAGQRDNPQFSVVSQSRAEVNLTASCEAREGTGETQGSFQELAVATAGPRAPVQSTSPAPLGAGEAEKHGCPVYSQLFGKTNDTHKKINMQIIMK